MVRSVIIFIGFCIKWFFTHRILKRIADDIVVGIFGKSLKEWWAENHPGVHYPGFIPALWDLIRVKMVLVWGLCFRREAIKVYREVIIIGLKGTVIFLGFFGLVWYIIILTDYVRNLEASLVYEGDSKAIMLICVFLSVLLKYTYWFLIAFIVCSYVILVLFIAFL